jgi:hypothetical protein
MVFGIFDAPKHFFHGWGSSQELVSQGSMSLDDFIHFIGWISLFDWCITTNCFGAYHVCKLFKRAGDGRGRGSNQGKANGPPLAPKCGGLWALLAFVNSVNKSSTWKINTIKWLASLSVYCRTWLTWDWNLDLYKRPSSNGPFFLCKDGCYVCMARYNPNEHWDLKAWKTLSLIQVISLHMCGVLNVYGRTLH